MEMIDNPSKAELFTLRAYITVLLGLSIFLWIGWYIDELPLSLVVIAQSVLLFGMIIPFIDSTFSDGSNL